MALDRQFNFQWGRESDDFSRNQVRARAESRADLMVLRPTRIVCDAVQKVDALSDESVLVPLANTANLQSRRVGDDIAGRGRAGRTCCTRTPGVCSSSAERSSKVALAAG